MLDNTDFGGYIGESNTNSCVVPCGVSLSTTHWLRYSPTGMDVPVLAGAPAQNMRLMLGGLKAVTLLCECSAPA